MYIENDLIKEYNEFMRKKSLFFKYLKIVPTTPKSFLNFPTIIFKESNNVDNIPTMSLNKIEYGENLTYQVDIYTKNITIDGKEYPANFIETEIRKLTSDFFRNVGFLKNSDVPTEYIDITVRRRTMLFSGIIVSWNSSII